jgi:hypothetical protein
MRRFIPTIYLFAGMLALTACTTEKAPSTSDQPASNEPVVLHLPKDMTVAELMKLLTQSTWTDSSKTIAQVSDVGTSQQILVFNGISLSADEHKQSGCGPYDLLSVDKSDRSAFPKDEKDPLTGMVHYEIWTAKICDQARRYGVQISESQIKVAPL